MIDMKKFLAVLALMVLLFGCIDEPTPEVVVEYGDEVGVYYSLYIDGKIRDTNIESIAQQEGVYNPEMPEKYSQPFTFKALRGEGVIAGFVDGVVGMKLNESKNFTVNPEDGYGVKNMTLVYNISRYYQQPMIEQVPIEYFEDKNITVEDGISFETDIGTVFIDGFTDTYANLTYVFEPGDIFYYANLPHKVTSGFDPITYMYTIERDVTLGSTYYTLSPVSGELSYLTVIAMDNETITFDENEPLTGAYLDYQVTVVDVTKQG
jgi:FKBP-type peptidyl-prolyl cis-trans isomerase 2